MERERGDRVKKGDEVTEEVAAKVSERRENEHDEDLLRGMRKSPPSQMILKSKGMAFGEIKRRVKMVYPQLETSRLAVEELGDCEGWSVVTVLEGGGVKEVIDIKQRRCMPGYLEKMVTGKVTLPGS